ncbi:hypothetical protein HYPDE_26618 [Hyphomicrobium denitrificans 1NES1]|uniref:Uncharacterized protein n=1 Tax=Hyphomicrobium denitrificans 1NES1 TaxID=670307 RepID=N0B0Q1_9HYPH|nr:hypothetical protein [Hyphomicrobium denitrificans]AGK57004.1 hypothetical protein HYPDE_26618 [Hyphomicrobium denitrificans 1NES1]
MSLIRLVLLLSLFSSTLLHTSEAIHIEEIDWDKPQGDSSYDALIGSRAAPNQLTFVGIRDFYYQLVVEPHWKRSECSASSSGIYNYLNTVMTDVSYISDVSEANDEVKSMPTLLIGFGVEPANGSRRSGCHLRSFAQQWTLRRYGGSEVGSRKELFKITVTASLASSFFKPLRDVAVAVAGIPAVAGAIPPGYAAAVTTLVDALVAAGAGNPVGVFSNDVYAAANPKAVSRIQIAADKAAGYTDIYVRRIGSLILDRLDPVGSEDVITISLNKAGDKFRKKFLEANKDYKQRIAIENPAKRKDLYTLCQTIRNFVDDELALSTIDAALIRRSFLIYQQYDKLLSDANWTKTVTDELRASNPELPRTLQDECWNNIDEEFLRKIIVTRLKKRMDPFGSYAVQPASSGPPTNRLRAPFAVY